MKKLPFWMLILLVCCMAVSPAGAAEAPSAADIVRLVDEAHTAHRSLHEMGSTELEMEGGAPLHCFFPLEPSGTVVSCSEVYVPWQEELPNDLAETYAVLMTLLETSLYITDNSSEVSLIDLEKAGDTLSVTLPDYPWWRYGETDTMALVAGPVLFTDSDDIVLDDTVYLFVEYITPDLTGLWLCADPYIVRHLLEDMIPPEPDDSPETAYLLQWLETARSEYIGTVTVTHRTRANLRAEPNTHGKSLDYAQPGDVLEVRSVAANGWYEVVYGHGAGTAFIGPTLVAFTPYE